jgi:hypothetical protein
MLTQQHSHSHKRQQGRLRKQYARMRQAQEQPELWRMCGEVIYDPTYYTRTWYVWCRHALLLAR